MYVVILIIRARTDPGCYHIADLVIGSSPKELTSATAFRIFPIADQYDMRVVHMWCSKAVDKTPLDLWPSVPIASSEVPKHPGLLQWLALADSKQCAPMVETCLSQLLSQESDEAIHEAMASPHMRQVMDGLRSETKTSIICKMAGLPLGFQVPTMIVNSDACAFVVAGNSAGQQSIASTVFLWYTNWQACRLGSRY